MNFCAEFRLENKNEILNFFSLEKGDIWGYLKALIKRIIHLFHKHIWISEDKLFSWVENHETDKISDLFINTRLFKKIRRYENHMAIREKNICEQFKDGLLFIWLFIKSPGSIGAILPSSNRLAKAMVRQIPNIPSTQKRYLLEVGPGTGVFSEKILKRMNPEDELHLVEFDRDFCDQLRVKFAEIPNIKIYEGSIADFDPVSHLGMPKDKKYDFVISGLPFNGFEKSFVEQILNKYVDMIADGGKISYFEYFLLTCITKIGMSQAKAQNLEDVLELKKNFFDKFGTLQENVWLNFPPAKVRHHTIHKIQKQFDNIDFTGV